MVSDSDEQLFHKISLDLYEVYELHGNAMHKLCLISVSSNVLCEG